MTDTQTSSVVIDGSKLDVGAVATSKPSNPKDAVGIRKWRNFVTVPMTVIAEVGVAMLEGHLKYRRHNFRVAGVRSSVYVDAAIGHIMQWWEGEDIDADSRLSHITKAIASLVVLRDAMIQNKLNDDRPPKGDLAQVRDELQKVVDSLFEKYPNGNVPYTEIGERMAAPKPAAIVGFGKIEQQEDDVPIDGSKIGAGSIGNRKLDALSIACTQIANERCGGPPKKCYGRKAREWQKVWDETCVQLGGDPSAYRANFIVGGNVPCDLEIRDSRAYSPSLHPGESATDIGEQKSTL